MIHDESRLPGNQYNPKLQSVSDEPQRPREEAKKAYDHLSRIYDFLTSGREEKLKGHGVTILDPVENEKILEIGCGTGSSLISLAEKVGPGGRVHGIDISEGMLRIARRKVADSGFSKRVELTMGDAIQLPYEDKYFDAVFMSFTLELFSTHDIPVILEEGRRVLKEEGRICVVTMSDKGKNTLMKRAYLWFHRRLPKYVDCRPILTEKIISENGFRVVESLPGSLYGLPVEIVLAKK